MARTTKSDVIIPEIFTAAVQARFAQKNLFQADSALANTGAVVVSDSFGGTDIGDVIKVPYFGTIGEFTSNMTDGDAVTAVKVAQTSESATVTRDSLAVEATRWSKSSAGSDAYVEGVSQVVTAAARAMDRRVIDAAVSTATTLPLKLAKYSSTVPRYFDYDLMVEGKMVWEDEQDDIVALAVHSATLADMYKLKDGNGRPLLIDLFDGSMPRFLGTPVVVSNRCPLTGSTMGSVTEAGTTPPDIAITTNTPNGPWSLKIVPVTTGARGTATIKFSLDGGLTYSAPIVTAASIALIDPAIDSTIGVNGASGLVISYENASSASDNVWTATSSGTVKATSMLIKKNAFAFWFNRAALTLQVDHDVTRDSDVAAMHLYAAALRYRRRPGSTKSGVVLLEHNARTIF